MKQFEISGRKFQVGKPEYRIGTRGQFNPMSAAWASNWVNKAESAYLKGIFELLENSISAT